MSWRKKGSITHISESCVEWKVDTVRSLSVGLWYCSPEFSFAGGDWTFGIRRDDFGKSEGELIFLGLVRCGDGPDPDSTMDIEYTLSVKDQDGARHKEQRNRKEFGKWTESPRIPIQLNDDEISELLPNDAFTILCDLKCFDPTQDAAQLKKQLDAKTAELDSVKSELERKTADELGTVKSELERKTAELGTVKRELGDKQSELVRLQRLMEELNLKMTDVKANRENVQKLHETKSNDCDSGSSSLLQKNKVLRDLKDLFLKNEECDVVLKVKGQEFSALKAILMARSPVFASTFKSDMKERATGVIEIEDCDPSCFSDFLCYLYCGVVENLSAENVFSLFAAADKYDVQDLRSECLEFVKKNLSVDTFCDTITLALRHSETELIDLATDFFTKNAPQVILTVKWQQFLADNPTQSNELFIKFTTSIGRTNE